MGIMIKIRPWIFINVLHVFLLLFYSRAASAAPDSLLPTTEAIVPGDLMLGALMMVHERENATLGCGDVMVQGGVQAVEAMIYTLDWVNRNEIIPHTNLGARILDDCDKDTYGLQHAVDFIKGKVESLQSGVVCNYVNSSGGLSNKPTVGVVAASSSITSIQVANLLKLFHIPQVSYFSSAYELAERTRYPYFFRTIPSDDGQVTTMREILKKFRWTYVSIIYEDSIYGTGAYDLLERGLREDGICIAYKEKLPKDWNIGRPEDFKPIVDGLKRVNIEYPMARGVIIYGSDQEVRGFMNSIRSEGMTGLFTFIGSDGWSAREEVYKDDELQAEVLGTISVQPKAEQISNFSNYFSKLTVENNPRNPWFYEMWERVFQCRYPGKKVTWINRRYNSTCTGRENIGYNYQFEKQLQFVSDAVLVFAYALKDYFRIFCGNVPECVACYNGRTQTEDCKNTLVDGTVLRDVMNNVTFRGLAANKFEFGENKNDPPPRYNIIHFREDPETNKPIWITVGNYTKEGLKIDMEYVQFYVKGTDGMKPPPSYCSNRCKRDEVQQIVGDSSCCWRCHKCKDHEIRLDERTCRGCEDGWDPNPTNRSQCIRNPIEVADPLSLYGVVCLLVAFVGILCTILQLAIFIKHNDTPIVKASGRELSYVIIAGLFLCFAVTPFTLAHPSMLVCGIQRFLSGFCFTVIYAAILTKTNRISRIFRSGRRTIRRPNFISPQSQLTICAMVASVQIVIVAIWMFAYPPSSSILHQPTRSDNKWVCEETTSNRYLLAYFYPICLCVICTVYAVRTRKMPEAFNESHYIGAAVYTTCVIWLAFVPVYIVAKDSVDIRVASVCISTSITAFVCQFSLFWPKVYIIVFKPERNVRASIMGPKATGTGVSKSLIRSASNAQAAASMATMYRTEDSSGGYSEDEYYQIPTANRRSESRMTVATQTSPLRDTDDEGVEERSTVKLSASLAEGGKPSDFNKLTLKEMDEDTARTSPLPPPYNRSGSRAGLESVSPATPGENARFDVNRGSRRKSAVPFSLQDQCMSAPYIDGDNSSVIVGNGSIEQGDVCL